MTRKQFGVTLASFLSNTQHPASFSPAWGGSSYHTTWRVFNGLHPSPQQARVFHTSMEGGNLCFFFSYFFFFFKHNLSFLPWGKLGSSSRAGSTLWEAAAPLSKEKKSQHVESLKNCYLGFCAEISLVGHKRGNVGLQHLC